jgi:hypothetical protein
MMPTKHAGCKSFQEQRLDGVNHLVEHASLKVRLQANGHFVRESNFAPAERSFALKFSPERRWLLGREGSPSNPKILFLRRDQLGGREPQIPRTAARLAPLAQQRQP